VFVLVERKNPDEVSRLSWTALKFQANYYGATACIKIVE
jgi:hypothetical protein